MYFSRQMIINQKIFLRGTISPQNLAITDTFVSEILGCQFGFEISTVGVPARERSETMAHSKTEMARKEERYKFRIYRFRERRENRDLNRMMKIDE